MNVVFAHSQNSVDAIAESGFDRGRLVGGHGLVALLAGVPAGIRSPDSAPLVAESPRVHGEVTA
ncbi:MAG: hypothetical protein JWQ19_310 [Subtercola sp.]|nr:hypothetical protein [Subtercola sp.]